MAELTSLYEFFTKESAYETKEGTFLISNIKARKQNETKKNFVLTITDGTYYVKAFLKDEAADNFRSSNDLKKGCCIKAKEVNAVIIAERKKFSMAIGQYDIIDYNTEVNSDLILLEDKYDELRKQSDIPIYDMVDEKEHSASAESPKPQAHKAEPEPLRRKTPVDRSLIAIELLSTYQNNWAIKARVSFKSDVKTWSNQRGSGSLFNVHFLDETGEIRGTAFNDACTKFSEMLQEGKVYRVSKARLRQANQKFSTLKHSYEIQLDMDTVIEECTGDDQDQSVPQVKYDLVKLDTLKNQEVVPNNQPGGEVDVLGVITKVDDAFQITSKAGKTYDRRNVTIVDDSKIAINVGLWNKPALDFSLPVGTVIVCKGCKLNDFRGKSLSMTPGGRIVESPDLKAAFKLKGWYNEEGKHATFENISESAESSQKANNDIDVSTRVPLNKLVNEEIGMNDTAEYVNFKGYVGRIKDQSFYYDACATPDCLKKVVDIGSGYQCEKCEKTHENCLKRYTLNMQLIDAYDSIWVSCFNEVGETLLGHNADELADDPELTKKLFDNKNMEPYNFRIKAVKREYNGIERANYTLVGISQIEYGKEVDHLSELLSQI